MYVAAGQGIGGGIVLDGRLMHGAIGTAGEIGHMSTDINGPQCPCGNTGCLELYSSTLSIVSTVAGIPRLSAAGKPRTFPDVVSMMETDHEVKTVVAEAAEYLGRGLVNLINILNPNVIVIGDDLVLAGDMVLSVVDRTVRSHILPELYNALNIEFCSIKEDPVLLGIATLVIDRIFQQPSMLKALSA